MSGEHDITLAILSALLLEQPGTRVTLSLRSGVYYARIERHGLARTAMGASLSAAVHAVAGQPDRKAAGS